MKNILLMQNSPNNLLHNLPIRVENDNRRPQVITRHEILIGSRILRIDEMPISIIKQRYCRLRNPQMNMRHPLRIFWIGVQELRHVEPAVVPSHQSVLSVVDVSNVVLAGQDGVSQLGFGVECELFGSPCGDESLGVDGVWNVVVVVAGKSVAFVVFEGDLSFAVPDGVHVAVDVVEVSVEWIILVLKYENILLISHWAIML